MDSVTADNDAPAVPASPPPPASPRATTSSYAFPSISALASGSSPASAGHALRRSVTVDDTPPPRRRPVSMISLPSSEAGESPAPGLRRRSSTLSDFSLSEARRSFHHGTRDILNPSAVGHIEPAQDASSVLSSIPLAIALLPALFGVLFEGGSAFITDVMLLALVFIFLRYTITQPWQWYHEAQEVRIRQEVGLEQVFEEDSEAETPAKVASSGMTLHDVPEETSQDGQDNGHGPQTEPEHHEEQETKASAEKLNRTRAQEAAVNELYIHEVLALLACFLSPILGAYLLHAIRVQLTHRSEGLMTNFNITVFLLAAELRPMSHALKLIQARTMHLQRIVQSVPMARSTAVELEEVRARLAQVELRAEANEEATAATLASATQQPQQHNDGSRSSRHEAALVREVRNAIQPELDALNRAVRRYEKKATVLALQTESRLGGVDMRLNDAISLAAAAVKQNNRSQWGFAAAVAWVTDWLVTIVTMPYHVAMYAIMWPFRTVADLCFKGNRRSSRDNRTGSGRSGRHSGFKGSRNGSGSDKDRYRDHRDRVPSRLSRRYSP